MRSLPTLLFVLTRSYDWKRSRLRFGWRILRARSRQPVVELRPAVFERQIAGGRR